MKKKAVIFDFNGTLVFDDYFHILGWKTFVEEDLQQTWDEEIKKRMIGAMNRDTLQSMFPDITEDVNLSYSQKKESRYREFCLQEPERYQLVKGATELFDYLKDNDIPFTIASASIKDNIDFFISNFTLEKWFDKHKIVYDDGRFVDKEGMYKEACKLLNVDPKDAIVIEDSVTGVSGAKRANIGTIIAIGDTEKREQLQAIGAHFGIIDYTSFVARFIENNR